MADDPTDFGDQSLPYGASGADWGEVGDDAPAPRHDHPFRLVEAERYERRQLLGRGGMGRVVVAWDRRLRREVALKEVLEGQAGPSSGSQRLAQEAWITAQLDHPGILPVLDAGQGEDGALFYTMPIVRGRTLGDLLAEALDAASRTALLPRLLAAAQAVAHAHGVGIVHRDLKPANVLVGALGEVQVADWGLARSTREAEPAWKRLLPDVELTAADVAAVRGSPHYMSPEQANGLPVGPPTDVWSLGVMLYELVSGARPFTGDSAPSVLAAVRRATPPPPPDACPQELGAIIERALQPDPAARYPDARALAEDLDRYLSGERVGAHTYTSQELLLRAVRAWRAPLLVAAAALVAVATVSALGWRGTIAERDRARAAEASLQETLDTNDALLAGALVLRAQDALAEQARPEAELLAARALQLREDPRARGVLAAVSGRPRPTRLGTVDLPAACLGRELPRTGDTLLCVAPDRMLAVDLSTGDVRWERAAEVLLAATPPGDGQTALLLLRDYQSAELDLETGAMTPVRRRPEGGWRLVGGPGPDQAVLIDGPRLRPVVARPELPRVLAWCGEREVEAATAAGGELLVLCADGTLARGPLATRPAASVPTDVGTDRRAPAWMERSPDGTRLAVATRDGELMILSLPSGETALRVPLGVGPLATAQWSADGERLLVTSSVGPAVVWSAVSETVVAQLPTAAAPVGRWEADGTLRLVGEDGVTHWRLPDQARPHRLPQQSGVSSVDVSPDGRHLATCRGDGVMRVLSTDDFATVATASRPGHVCKDVVFTADDRAVVATYAQDRSLVLDLAVEPPALTDLDLRARRLLSLVGPAVVGLPYSEGGPVPLDVGRGREDRLRLAGVEMWEGDDAHGRRFAVGLQRDGRVVRFEGGADATVRPLWLDPTARALDITSDGVRVAVARAAGGGVVVRSADDGAVLRTLEAGERRHTEVAWSADGRWLAVGDMSGETQLFRDGDTAPLAILSGHRHQVAALAFTPDGRTLVTGSWDGDLRLWDLAAIEQDPEALLAEASAAWGLTADQLLDR